MQSLLLNINKAVENVAEATESVNNSSVELAEASRQMESGSIQQQQQTDQAATAVEEMSATVLEVAKNSSQASDFAIEASQVATEGGDVVKHTIEGIKRIATTVDDSTKIVSALGESSNKIGQIVSVIEDIVAQTNLLALNAAIEAARAGEQGRGFAVVADEVRNLAQRTSDATSEIAGMIGAIQSDTKNVVSAMANGTNQVEEGVELTNQAGVSLDRIVDVIGNVPDMVRQITTAAEEQSSVADEISKNITGVAEITHETARISQQSSLDNQALTQQAGALQQRVSQFKL
jgi:methyl-accepting chemotaxis protein